MEIITSVKYDPDNHQLVNFLKTGVKPFIIQLMDPRAVRRAVDNRKHMEAVELIIQHRWTSMLVGKSQTVGQLIPIKLADNHWANVHLVINGTKDRLIIFISGKGDLPVWMHIGYVGSKKVFDEYTKLLNISEFELVANLTHLNEEE